MQGTSTIQMQIEETWLKNDALYFPKECAGFFPPDCFGARGKPELLTLPARGTPVTLDFGTHSVETDISMQNGGRIRPRDRGSVRRFYEDSKAAPGDFIIVTKVGMRKFKISVARAHGAAV